MIYWQGKKYKLITQRYNGDVMVYLLDGDLYYSERGGTHVQGYFVTEAGVVVVLKRNVVGMWALLLVLTFVATFALWPRQRTEYYQVTFAESPLLVDTTLYCNVLNESSITVDVQFLDATHKTVAYTLLPGESLPYIFIDFVPEAIRYNGKDDFRLEVHSD